MQLFENMEQKIGAAILGIAYYTRFDETDFEDIVISMYDTCYSWIVDPEDMSPVGFVNASPLHCPEVKITAENNGWKIIFCGHVLFDRNMEA